MHVIKKNTFHEKQNSLIFFKFMPNNKNTTNRELKEKHGNNGINELKSNIKLNKYL